MDSLQDYYDKFVATTLRVWRYSKFLRVVTITYCSLKIYFTLRNGFYILQRKYKKLPNGPTGFPYIGFIEKRDYSLLRQLATNYGCLATVNGNKGIYINNPFLAKKIHLNSKVSMVDRPDVTLIDNSLFFLFSNGKPWAERRKIIYSTILTTMNKAFYIEQCTKGFIKNKVYKEIDNQINKNIHLKELFIPIGFNIVLQTCFGKELKSLYGDEFFNKWLQRINKFNAMSLKKVFVLVIYILSVLISGTGMEFILRWVVNKTALFGQLYVMKRTLTEYLNNKHVFNDDETLNKDIFDEYKQKYLELNYTEEQLIGDMSVMFMAASETTANTLSFCLLYLAKYANIQNELYQEINTAFDGDVDQISLQNNGALKVPKLRAFLHEILRLKPPIATTAFRQINNKNGLEVDTTNYDQNGKIYKIPFKMHLFVNVIAISMNSKYWKSRKSQKINNNMNDNINMNKIHFEFWLDDDDKFSKKANNDSFLAFSLGKRNCVGQALAIKQMLIILAMIICKYQIKFPDFITKDPSKVDIENYFDISLNAPIITHIRMKQRQ
eukprot:555431_1